MGRNIRVVRVEWGPSAPILIAPDRFEELLAALVGGKVEYRYTWNGADEVFKLWTAKGSRFLDLIRDCTPKKAKRMAGQLGRELRRDVLTCLKNLRAMEPEWRKHLDKDGQLELWVDGF